MDYQEACSLLLAFSNWAAWVFTLLPDGYGKGGIIIFVCLVLPLLPSSVLLLLHLVRLVRALQQMSWHHFFASSSRGLRHRIPSFPANNCCCRQPLSLFACFLLRATMVPPHLLPSCLFVCMFFSIRSLYVCLSFQSNLHVTKASFLLICLPLPALL